MLCVVKKTPLLLKGATIPSKDDYVNWLTQQRVELLHELRPMSQFT